MEEIKVSYKQIEKANNEITYIGIKRFNKETGEYETKAYAEVHERVKAFRKVYPQGNLPTEMIKFEDGECIFKCTVYDEKGNMLASGTAGEKLTGNSKKDYINLTSMLENCETSAIGRALGFAGFGVAYGIATAEEINRAEEKESQKDNEPMTEEQLAIISNLDIEQKDRLREFYSKDIMKLTKTEAEISINSLKSKGLIKTKQEEIYEKKEKEEVF